MPLPMVHLAVAYGLHSRAGEAPAPGFLLGSLAPDAIHMRAAATRADKRVTHLQGDAGGEWPAPVRAWLAAHARSAAGPWREYLRGYAAHLLTDHAWYEAIVRPYREGLPPEVDKGEMRRRYYRDMDQVDLSLYRTAPWRAEAWRGLAVAAAADVPGLLSAAEVDAWRRRTLGWFDDPAHDPGVAPTYISEERVRAFIGEGWRW